MTIKIDSLLNVCTTVLNEKSRDSAVKTYLYREKDGTWKTKELTKESKRRDHRYDLSKVIQSMEKDLASEIFKLNKTEVQEIHNAVNKLKENYEHGHDFFSKVLKKTRTCFTHIFSFLNTIEMMRSATPTPTTQETAQEKKLNLEKREHTLADYSYLGAERLEPLNTKPNFEPSAPDESLEALDAKPNSEPYALPPNAVTIFNLALTGKLDEKLDQFSPFFENISRDEATNIMKAACGGGQKKTVQFLVKKYPELVKDYNYFLKDAATFNRLEIVNFLLLKGAPVSLTAVAAAFTRGHDDLAEYLLARGKALDSKFGLDSRSPGGNSIFYFLSMWLENEENVAKFKEIASRLPKFSNQINKTNRDGATLLNFYLDLKQSHNHPINWNLINFLVERGASWTHQNNEGMDPISALLLNPTISNSEKEVKEAIHQAYRENPKYISRLSRSMPIDDLIENRVPVGVIKVLFSYGYNPSSTSPIMKGSDSYVNEILKFYEERNQLIKRRKNKELKGPE